LLDLLAYTTNSDFGQLLSPLDRLHDVGFNHVAFSNIVILIKGNSTFIALCDFLGIVLEALERIKLAFVDDNTCAKQTSHGIARNLTVDHHTACNRTYLGNLE